MSRARGFTLIEATVSTLIVGLMLAAALRLVGASALAQQQSTDRSRGVLLAADLLAEIQALPYDDPNDIPLLGIELSELLSGRAGFDDVDDYDGLTESPPKDSSGKPLNDFADWGRRVRVDYVNLLNPALTSGSDTGVKRITVQAVRNGRVVAQVVGIRTRAHDAFVPKQ